MQTTIHKINKQQGFTEKYIQYLIITFNGKEAEYIYIYTDIYIKLNHFITHLKLTL